LAKVNFQVESKSRKLGFILRNSPSPYGIKSRHRRSPFGCIPDRCTGYSRCCSCARNSKSW